MLDQAETKNFVPADFKSFQKLKEINAKKETDAEFEKFLFQLRFAEMKRFTASYLTAKGYDVQASKTITENLSSFFCLKRHGANGNSF